MSFIFALTFAAQANALPLGASGQLLFKSDSDPVTLDSGMRGHVTQKLEEIASSCQYPQDSQQDWKDKIFSPYGFHITYEQPRNMTFHTYKGGDTGETWQVIDIFLPLDDDPVATGVYVRTADKKWSYLFKCNGAQMIDLVCTPQLQQYMPEEGSPYQLACANRSMPDIEQKNAEAMPPANSAPETSPAAGDAIGAARILIPQTLEKALPDLAGDNETRAVEQEMEKTIANENLPLFTPEAGSAFEIQADEIILQ